MLCMRTTIILCKVEHIENNGTKKYVFIKIMELEKKMPEMKHTIYQLMFQIIKRINNKKNL
jgi:hypothetical protein